MIFQTEGSFWNFQRIPVLRLHGISPMAMANPSKPPVAMYCQYVATGGKSHSEFHQWPSVDYWWKTPGHRWKFTIFEVITWYVAHLDAKKWKKWKCNFAGNFAITYSRKTITQSKVSNSTFFEDMDAGLLPNDAAGWIEENFLGLKSFQKVHWEKSAMNVILLSSKSQFERTISTQNFL